MSLWVSSGGPACRGWGGRGGADESQAVQEHREFGSGMLAEHRRVIDVTKKKKEKEKKNNERQQESTRHKTMQCPCLSGQEKVEDYGKHVGWRTSETQNDRGQMSLMP